MSTQTAERTPKTASLADANVCEFRQAFPDFVIEHMIRFDVASATHMPNLLWALDGAGARISRLDAERHATGMSIVCRFELPAASSFEQVCDDIQRILGLPSLLAETRLTRAAQMTD